MIRNRFSKKDDMFEDGEANPMESVANLTDVMLVLAVGIMLALIMAWKVDIKSVNSQQISKDQAVEIEADTVGTESSEDIKSADDDGLQEAGVLYKDEDGNYYMLPDE